MSVAPRRVELHRMVWARVWRLAELLERWPDGYVLVRRSGSAAEVLFVIPRHASTLEEGVDAAAQVARLASRYRLLEARGTEKGYVRLQVACYTGSELPGGWKELGVAERASLGL